MQQLGDALAQEALTAGTAFAVGRTGAGGLRLAITLNTGDIQHFERPAAGGDWMATDLEDQGAGCTFNERVTVQWGRGLELLAAGQEDRTVREPAIGAIVARVGRIPEGQLRPFGDVVGHATDPFTGERLVRVQWPSHARPTSHPLGEVVETD